ncbi:flagellar hook-basal body complex protein [bacterium]|nr:flagellar hook-basal body complex protein [bacterium]
MFKSLYSGVSGMSANMAQLDVIGNNIANSGTTGFKAGRTTFSEMLTQTIRSASRPVSGGLGGTNPQQIGLGVAVGSIDTNFTQGNFQTTGIKTDLAVQGNGFFVLSDGQSNVYTRAGVFGLDAENNLVNPSTGLRVQGVMADEDGNIANGPLDDLFIDPSLVVPAEASSSVQLLGNLDADSDALGSVLETPTLLAAAAGTDTLVDLSGQDGQSLGLYPGDLINLNGQIGGADITADTFEVTSTTTLDDLVTWLNAQGGPTFAIAADGSIEATAGGADVENLSLFVSNRSSFNLNFGFPSTIPAGTTAGSDDASGNYGQLRAYAEETDLLSEIYTSTGTQLGLDFSGGPATLEIGGEAGTGSVSGSLAVDELTTTVGDLTTELQNLFSINTTPVTLEEGRIVMTGEVGAASAITSVTIAESGVDNSTISSAMSFGTTQQARDQRNYSVSTTVYDSLGGEHTINFSFIKVPGQNEWIWEAEMEGGETITAGDSGRVSFNDTGAVTNFTYDNGAAGITIEPEMVGNEGAQPIQLNVDFGEVGGLNGLTQFEGSGNISSLADGYQAGSLVDFEIDQSGVIVGRFSNDTMRSIGRIALAQFNNEAGLLREANNTYSTSGNSGDAVTVFAGDGSGVTLNPGALETSNVDLAQEFTRLVVAQRSFQANSRVVTTGDSLMQELVNLVR